MNARVLCILPLAFSLCCVAQGRGPYETTSLLGQKLYAEPTDASIAAAGASHATAADYLAVSKGEAGRRQYQEAVRTDSEGLRRFPNNADLLLERGHRELGLREFAPAQKDLEQAVAADPTNLDSHYHLGLAFYFQRDFTKAAAQLAKARDLAKTDDSLIDCTAWLYVSLRRASHRDEAAAALARITPALHNTEPHLLFYLHLLRFYQGQSTEADILPAKPAPGDAEAELSYDTINYGIGNWHLYNGDPSAAKAFFERVVTGEAWNAWGFIGSEIELAHR